MAQDYLVFGRNILKEAVAAQVEIKAIYYQNNSALDFIRATLGVQAKRLEIRSGIPSNIQKENHQGVAFRIQHDFYLKDWNPRTDPYPIVLLCNHLQDVQNLGGLSRLATAFGASLLVHEERRSARLNETVVRVSAGTAFHLKYLEVANLTPLVISLKDEGYEVVGLESARESDVRALFGWQPRFPLALVVGSEGEGISRPILKQLDTKIHIPMSSQIESLNATQATGIALSWIFNSQKSQK